MSRSTEDENSRTLEEELYEVRALKEEDLEAIVRIDESAMGEKRREYYRDKVSAALRDSRMRVSLVAVERPGAPGAPKGGLVVGFLMAALHYGEFGQPASTAVIDSLGVHAEYQRKRVGKALMRQFITNLKGLGVHTVRTEVGWTQFSLLGFLAREGFAPGKRLVLELDLDA